MDRLTAATVFVDVASTGSFTATAERLEMSRPMVTRYVDAMEDWLNTRLLHRTTRKVSLTTAGEQCLTDIQDWIEQAKRFQDDLTVHDALSGKIRVSTSMSFSFAQLIPAVNAFMQQHPLVEVDIDAQDSATDLIKEHIDLAIRITSNPDPSLIGRPIASCESLLVAAPSYLSAAAEIKQPSELKAHRCLGYKNFERHIWHLNRNQQHQSVEVNCHLTANEATTLLSAAIQGMGIALLPSYLAHSALAKGDLAQVLPQWQPKVMEVYALYSSRKHLSLTVRSLIDHLVEYFSNDDWQSIRL